MNDNMDFLTLLETDSASLFIWRDIYKYFFENGRFPECANCLINVRKLQPKTENEEYIFRQLMNEGYTAFVAIHQLLQEKRVKKCIELLNHTRIPLLMVNLYAALAYYYDKQYNQAEKCMAMYINQCKQSGNVCNNEEAFFYLGNTYYRMNRYKEALACYKEALAMRQSFSEARWNSALSHKRLGNNDIYYDIVYGNKLEILSSTEDIIDSLNLHSQLTVTDFSTKAEIKNIPIFINAFNRLTCLKKLLEWFAANEYSNIYVLDNNSTYPPLLEYYDSIVQSNNKAIKIILLKENLGHTSLWQSNLLEKLDIRTPYIYTDPDTIPTVDCGEECISYLLKILRENPLVKKVGLGIKIDDITYFDKAATQEFEKQYWKYSFNKRDYFAAVDTTFALYRNIRYYTLANSIRTGYPYLCNHLPFYLDYDKLPEEERYYIEHVNVSASLANGIKNSKLSNLPK